MTEIRHPDGKERAGRDALYLLYQPLTGPDALLLYETLCCLDQTDEKQLKALCGLSGARLNTARMQLERMDLLARWHDSLSRRDLWILYHPRRPLDFLRHETFSRLLLRKVGKERFDWLLVYFDAGRRPDNMVNLSREIDPLEVFEDWPDAMEELYQERRPAQEDYGFDWERFYRNCEVSLPLSMRTRENEGLIAELAHFYGLDEDGIRPMVIRACPRPGKVLDWDLLRRLVRKSREIGGVWATGYQISPIAFLREKQNWMPVSEADRRLLEMMKDKYKMPNVLINHLVEYILESTNQQLSRALMGKIASTWQRLGIDTEEKAVEWMKNAGRHQFTYRSRQPVIRRPETDSSEDVTPADPELLARALALQKGESE